MSISRIPTIPAPELARILDGTGAWEFRVEVMRPGDATWTNLSAIAGGDWVLGVSTQADSPDQPVGRFTLSFMARADGRSVAPGISGDPINLDASSVFAPILYPGNYVRIYAANHTAPGAGDGPFRLWLRGRIDDVEWPENDVVCPCVTPDAEVERAWVTAEEERGAPDPGTPLETEIQGLLDLYAPWVGTLRVYNPDSASGPELGIGEYVTEREALGPQLREWVKSIGWDLRYLWDETAGDYVYTLYLPPRDKVVQDMAILSESILAVPALRVSREYVRNDFELEYPDAAAGERLTVTDEDLASQQQYGPAYMRISEPDNSLIQTAAAASTLLGYAKHDLAQPPTTKRIRLPFIPWLTLHDLLEVEADDVRFDYQTQWSVVGTQHNVTAGELYTEANLVGGSPVGQYFAWLARGAPPAAEGDSDIHSVDQIGETSEFRVTFGSRVLEADIHYKEFDVPRPEDYLEQLYDKANLREILTTSGDSFTAPNPPEGKILFGVAIPRDSQLRVSGEAREFRLDGGRAPITFTISAPENAAGTVATHTVTITEDPRGVVSGVRTWEQRDGEVTGPFTHTRTGDVFTRAVALPTKPHVVLVRGEILRNDGQPASQFGPDALDSDKVPGIPDVREVRVVDQASLYVDAPDTDTVSLWYQEVIGGAPQPEVEIAPRGADPRFGAFTVTADPAAERSFRIYGKNSAGDAGEYRDVVVAQYVEYAEAADVAQELNDLEAYIDGAFEDAVISAAEAKAIAEHIRQLNTEKTDLDERYTVLIVNPLLTGTAASNLTSAKGAYDTAHSDLLATIAAAIADGAITSGERAAVDTGFAAYETALALLSQRFTQALDAVQPPVMHEEISEDGSTGTLTLTPLAGAAFDTVEFSTRSGNGAWSAWLEDSSAPYSASVVLDAKHPSAIAYRISRDGGVIQQRVVPGFDVGTEVRVMDALPAYAGGIATVRVQFDTDQAVGAGEAGYRLDGGSETLVDVDANREASIAVTQSTSAEILFEVRGYNAAGAPGPWFAVTIEKYVPVSIPPRVSGLTVAVDTPLADCATSAPLKLLVEWEIYGDGTGHTLDIYYIDDLGTESLEVNDSACISGQFGDTHSGVEEVSVGARVDYGYRVEIRDAVGDLVDSRATTRTLRLVECSP